jgi:hypothetical protein
MERAWSPGREAIDFNAAEPAFSKSDLEVSFFLAGDQNRRRIREKRIVADEQQMLSLLKGRETGDEPLDRAFRSQLGDFFEMALQAKGIGYDIRRLTGPYKGARKNGIEGDFQTAEASGRSTHALDSFRSKCTFTVGLCRRPFSGDRDAMAHQIEIHAARPLPSGL